MLIKIRYLMAIIGLFFMSINSLLAQNPADNNIPLTELTPEVLTQRASQFAISLEEIYQRILVLNQQYQELTQQLDVRAMERASLELPKIPDAINAKMGAETVQLTLTAWENRNQQLTTLQTLLESQQLLANKQREMLLKLISEYQLVEQARQKLKPLLDELYKRWQAEQINLENLPVSMQDFLKSAQQAIEKVTQENQEKQENQGTIETEIETKNVPAAPAVSTEKSTLLNMVEVFSNPLQKIQQFQASTGRIELMLSEIETALATLKTDQQLIQAEIPKIALMLQEANYRIDLKKEFENRDFADLISLFNTRNETWRKNLQLNEDQYDLLTAKKAELEGKEKAINELKSPHADQFTVEETNPSLKEAKESAMLAEATVQFRQQRQQDSQQLQEQLSALIGSIETQETDLDKLIQETIEFEVLAQMLNELSQADKNNKLPEHFSLESIAEKLSILHQQENDLVEQKKRDTDRLAQLNKSLEESVIALEESRKHLEQQQARLESEQRWASFLSEVNSQSSPALMDTFKQTLIDYEATREEWIGSQISAEISLTLLNILKTELNAIHNPMVLEQTQKQADFVKWREQQDIRLTVFSTANASATEAAPPSGAPAAAAAATTTPSAAPATPPPPAAPQGATATQAATSTPVAVAAPAVLDSQVVTAAALTEQMIEQTRQIRDQMATRNLLTLHKQNEVTISLLAAYDLLLTHLQTQQAKNQELLELARQAWGSASALQIRHINGDADISELPKEAEKWTSREQVLNLQKQGEDLKLHYTAIEREKAVLLMQQVNPAFSSLLSDWENNLTRQIAQLKERQELEAKSTPPNPNNMDEFEKRRHDRQVNDRLQSETYLYETALSLFVAKQAEDTTQLLEAYYQRLLGLEYRYQNLQARKEKTEELIRLIEGMRPLFANLIEALQPFVNQQQKDLEVEAVKVKVALSPTQSSVLFARLKEKTGVTLMLSDVPQLPSTADEAAYKTALDELMNRLLEPWASAFVYSNWLDWFKQQQAKLGGIDTRINTLKGSVASLEASQKEITQQIYRLAGYSEELISTMPVEQQPVNKQARENLLLGDIGLLRQERLNEMEIEAFNTFIWLLIIPFIAFLTIRVVVIMGRRAVMKARKEAEQDAIRGIDHEERVKMLVHVFTIGWKMLVILLTIIYMFKAVNIDVLPILASAGVLGLAVAFGAQQLVRDFFSGFFILLENQFRVGDSVIINGLSGQVERITPRITLVRSLTEGSLHYIPNGSISHVSNNSREWGAIKITLPVSYQAEPTEVLACLQQVTDELLNDPSYATKLQKVIHLGIEEFGELAVTYAVLLKCKPTEQWPLAREYRRRVKLHFEQAGIEIPSLSNLSSNNSVLSKRINK